MFSWMEFLQLAESLAQFPDDEAKQRTVISRSYYFVYHITTEAVVGQRQWVRRDAKHRVWTELKQLGRSSNDKLVIDIGVKGLDLKLWREWADYTLPFAGVGHHKSVAEAATSAIEEARTIADLIAKLK